MSRDLPFRLRLIDLLAHYQGKSVEFTMKSFKGLFNKLGPLGFISQSVWYNHSLGSIVCYPVCTTRVTSNKLEKILKLS